MIWMSWWTKEFNHWCVKIMDLVIHTQISTVYLRFYNVFDWGKSVKKHPSSQYQKLEVEHKKQRCKPPPPSISKDIMLPVFIRAPCNWCAKWNCIFPPCPFLLNFFFFLLFMLLNIIFINILKIIFIKLHCSEYIIACLCSLEGMRAIK